MSPSASNLSLRFLSDDGDKGRNFFYLCKFYFSRDAGEVRGQVTLGDPAGFEKISV